MEKVEADPSPEEAASPPEGDSKEKSQSALERIIAFFFRSEDPQKEKRRLVREVGKQLRRMKQRLYDPGGEMALPGLGRLMFVYYKLFGPAQNLVKRAESSKALKEIVIECGMSDGQRHVRSGLEEAAIRERLKTTTPKELAERLKEELAILVSDFTADRVKEIDATYNQLASFLELIHFDYYFLLKKYDSRMPENNFAYEPRFEPINGECLLDDLKEFDDILLGIDVKSPWSKLFSILRAYRSVEVIPEKSWPKALKKLLDLRMSRVFELIIRHLSKDPAYASSPAGHNEKITEQYMVRLKTQTELMIQKILREKKEEKIEELAKQLFTSGKVQRMRNYTEMANAAFQRQMFSGYLHVPAVNYTRAFLDGYFAADIHDLVNLLLIKGKWISPQASQPLSDNLHRLFKLSDNIEELDRSLAEEEDTGRKLKNLCYGAAKDKKLAPRVRKLLGAINESAHALVYETATNLISIGRILKRIREDGTKKNPELILNWREINSSMDGALSRLIVDVYKKIYCFVQLMQFFIDREKVPVETVVAEPD